MRSLLHPVVGIVAAALGASCSSTNGHPTQVDSAEARPWMIGAVAAPLEIGEPACVPAGPLPVTLRAPTLGDEAGVIAAADGVLYVHERPRPTATTDAAPGCLVRHDLATGQSGVVRVPGYWGQPLEILRGRPLYQSLSVVEEYETPTSTRTYSVAGDVRMFDVTAGTVTALPNASPTRGRAAIVVTAKDVFWKSEGDGSTRAGERATDREANIATFHRWHLSSGNVGVTTVRWSGRGFAVAGGELFYLRKNVLEGVSIDGGAARAVFDFRPTSLPVAIIHADSERVFVMRIVDTAGGAELIAIARDGTDLRVLTRDVSVEIFGVADEVIYHPDHGGHVVMATPKAGGPSVPISADPTANDEIVSVTTDACNVYWATRAGAVYARSHDRAAGGAPRGSTKAITADVASLCASTSPPVR